MSAEAGKAPRELQDRARELYEACPTPKPTWDQLGPATQSVWIGYAAREKEDLDRMLE